MNRIVAIDPGFGNTKVVIDGQVAVLQSAVARPSSIGLAASGMKTVEMADQVTLESGAYVTGENSWQWGEPLGGLDYSTLVSEPRKALVYACIARLLPPGEHALDLVVGLPVPLLQDAEQSRLLVDSLRLAYKGDQAFRTPIGHYRLTINQIRVTAQPVGAWSDWLISPELRTRKGGRDAEVAVLDIGMNTLDLYVVQGGRVEPRFIGGGKTGVRRILAGLNGHGQDLEEIDAGLRRGRLKPSREALDSWMAAIFSQVERVWPDLRRFSAVIPCGGGSALLGDLLRLALIARGAAVSWPADPVTTNAAGLWKWGSYNAKR